MNSRLLRMLATAPGAGPCSCRSLVLAVALACIVPLAERARAQQTISTAVTGPVSGQGGTFTVTTTGAITGGGNGIEAGTGGGAITGLDVQGSVTVSGYALNVADGASLSSVTNSGLMSGDRVIQTYGGTTMGLITNSGTMSATGYGVLLYGPSQGLVNEGLVSATTNDAIYLIGPTGGLQNIGTVTAGNIGVFVYDTLQQAVNFGVIQGGNHGLFVNSTGVADIIYNFGTITGVAGRGVQNSGSMQQGLGNGGLIEGVRGLQADPGSSFGIIQNTGTVRGSEYGMVLYATTDTLQNTASGLIEATTNTDAIYHEGTTTTLINEGNILGVRNGILNTGNGTISSLTNSGTISGPGNAGLQLSAATTTTTLTNTGVIDGKWGVYQGAGTVTTLTNSGTLSGTGYVGDGLYVGGGTIGSLVNEVGGRIAGNNMGLENTSGGTIGSIDNAGTITGWWGLYSPGALGSFVNRSTGLVHSNGFGNEAFATGQLLDSFTNEAGGVIRSDNGAAVSLGSVTTAVNAGTIEGGSYGVQTYGGTIDSFTNTGVISGTSRGFNQDFATLTSLTNSGTISGGSIGMRLNATSGTISNLAGGLIAGTNDDGVQVSGNVTSLSNAGTISGGTGFPDGGVELVSSGTIGTLTNTGSITGWQGVRTNNSSGIGSLVNSGTIRGTLDGIQHDGGTIGSIVNQAGGLIRGDGDVGVDFTGDIGTLDNAGTITGEYGVYASGDIGTFVNRSTGVVTGTGSGYGFYSSGAVGTFTNEAGGLIESTNYEGVYLTGDGVGTFTNAGTIRSLAVDDYAGLYVDDEITTLTNSGTISGYYGISQGDAIGTLTNTATGLLQGTDSGLYIGDSDPVTVINHGRITGGGKGVYAYYDFGPLTNKSGGVISGTNVAGILIEDDARTDVATITNEAGGLITSASGAGIRVNAAGYDPGAVVNAGTIEGATAGFDIAGGGLVSIANTGTIRFTGSGTGPAVWVGPGGSLGDAAPVAVGPALTSTGAGALLDGTIQNQGTVYGGFTIENQSVTVSADGGLGIFLGGTLDVVDGDLTFTGGRTNLSADVSVNGGTGTVFNEAVLGISLGPQSITGNFVQTSAGTTSSIITDTSTFGSLAISGSALFGGTLDLDPDPFYGFMLEAGQTFNLFSFDSYAGGFSGLSVGGVALTSFGANKWLYGGLVLEENWSATSMSVSIAPVPEPSTFALGAAGIACAAWLRHRRRAAARKA